MSAKQDLLDAARNADAEYGQRMGIVERLRNGGQPDLAGIVESMLYALINVEAVFGGTEAYSLRRERSILAEVRKAIDASSDMSSTASSIVADTRKAIEDVTGLPE